MVVVRNVAQRRRNRLLLIGGAGLALALAVALVFFALGNRVSYFRTPTQIAAGEGDGLARLRIGGLVKDGSVSTTGTNVSFVVTDTAADVPVSYAGTLPDLFREGQGIVVDGRLDAAGRFLADTVLAKHDENYMPREVKDALEAQGVWRGDVE